MRFTFLFSLLSLFTSNSHAQKNETAILAGGCFWGMQELINQMDGVVKSRVGYTGGRAENPSYELISTGLTGHAEWIYTKIFLVGLLIKLFLIGMKC